MTRRVAGSRRERGPVPSQEPDLVVVGRIGKPQGIKGEVTVEVRTDDPDVRFADGATLLTESGTLTVAHARDHSGRLVVLFEGVTDRNGAEALRDTLLHVDAADLPDLDDDDDFYDSQLVGLTVELVDGTRLGTLTDVLHLPHGDVLVVARADRGTGPGAEVLVPFVKAMVPTVDLATGRVLVDPPPGLLDLDATVEES